MLPLLLRIAVIPLVEGPGDLSGSTVLDLVAAEVEWRPSLELVNDADLFSGNSTFARCGAKEECIAEELRANHIEIGLVVVVNTEVEPGLVSIRAIDSRSAAARSRASGSLGAEGPEVLARLVEKTLDDLGHPRAAKLRVVSDPALENVQIDPPAIVQIGPGLFFVAPGRHHLTAPGAIEISVEARAGEEVEARLTPPPSRSIVESPWFWIAIGGAVVAAGAVTAAVIATRPNDVCLCLGRPADECPDC